MTSVILTVNITSQLCRAMKHLSIQWKRQAQRLEHPGGRGRKAPLPLLLLPLEVRETEGGTEIVVGAHQDVVILQGMGEDPHDMEEWGHHQRVEEGPTAISVSVQG